MILGVGTDIAEIGRMEAACQRETFLNKVFTKKEQQYANGNISILAGDFAVKEAVVKVFGTGFRGIRPADIEVLRDSWGKPYVVLYNGALKQYEMMGMKGLLVSISNTKDLAIAFAVGEG